MWHEDIEAKHDHRSYATVFCSFAGRFASETANLQIMENEQVEERTTQLRAI